MSDSHAESALASYRDEVTGLMQSCKSFGAVEDAIYERVDLTEDAKAAMWLLAFSLCAPGDQLRDAHAHIAAVA